MNLLPDTAWCLAGLALALTAGLAVMRRMNRTKRSAAAAIGAAILMAFGHVYSQAREEMVLESADETKRKKGSAAGDPPVAGKTAGPALPP